eukprot:16368-Heterococcus_DN1.PRE.8
MSRSALERSGIRKLAQVSRELAAYAVAHRVATYYAKIFQGIWWIFAFPNLATSHFAFLPRAYEEAEQLTENREVKLNELPVHGNTRTYNLNTLLAQTIMASDYFRSLYELETFEDVVDEIYNRCDHCAPWAAGTSRIPSSSFCLLMKLFIMRITVPQMQTLLDHTDSPYIRAVGFLYLRYTCPPKEMWKWLEPYIDDEEELLFQGVQGCSAAVVSSAHSILVLALFAVSDSSAVLQSELNPTVQGIHGSAAKIAGDVAEQWFCDLVLSKTSATAISRPLTCSQRSLSKLGECTL